MTIEDTFTPQEQAARSANRLRGLPDLRGLPRQMGRDVGRAELVRHALVSAAEEELRELRAGIAYLQDRDREEWRLRMLEVAELEARLRRVCLDVRASFWNSRQYWTGQQLLKNEGRSV